jgi:hypothetical protein
LLDDDALIDARVIVRHPFLAHVIEPVKGEPRDEIIPSTVQCTTPSYFTLCSILLCCIKVQYSTVQYAPLFLHSFVRLPPRFSVTRRTSRH